MFAKTFLQGSVPGKRISGRQKMRWEDKGMVGSINERRHGLSTDRVCCLNGTTDKGTNLTVYEGTCQSRKYEKYA